MTTIYLTDTDSDLAGYLLAKLDEHADVCSLVRAVTATEDGPTAGLPVTRIKGGTPLVWLTEPLAAVQFTAAAWSLRVWALQSDTGANAALRLTIKRFTTSEQDTIVSATTASLPTTRQALVLTTGDAATEQLANGDRLAIRLEVVDADPATLVGGHTVEVSINGFYPSAEGDTVVTCPDTLRVNRALPAAVRSTLRNRLKDTAQTDPFLTDDELDESYAEAVVEYSSDRPREVVAAYSGDGSTDTFRLPREWLAGFSWITRIEHPLGNWPRSFLEPSDYTIVHGAIGVQPTAALRFVSAPSAGTENILVTYTTRHRHDDELCTIPSSDRDAVLNLAASKAALKAAARMAATVAPTISADSESHRDGVQRWREIARAYQQAYRDHIAGRGANRPTIAFADLDVYASDRLDRLTHGQRWR